jgi:hypothetical protein
VTRNEYVSMYSSSMICILIDIYVSVWVGKVVVVVVDYYHNCFCDCPPSIAVPVLGDISVRRNM